MFIHEALDKAIESKTSIRRKAWINCGLEWELSLTEPVTAITMHKDRCCWNPTVQDLKANDWELCLHLYGNGELIEANGDITTNKDDSVHELP